MRVDDLFSDNPFDGPQYTDPMASGGRDPAAPPGRTKSSGGSGGKLADYNEHSIKLWRKRGYACFVTQFFEAHFVWNAELRCQEYVGGHRFDLFGCMDGMAFKFDRPGVIGFQSTGMSNDAVGSRIRKACKLIAKDGSEKGSNMLIHWLGAGNRFLVLGWEKPGHRWEHTMYEITKEVVEAVNAGKRLDLKSLIVEGGQGRLAA